MPIVIRSYEDKDVPAMRAIWNEVVEEGVAFPQTEPLGEEEARTFFAAQTACRVAEETGTHHVMGFYILHPNNVGRCGHIGNTSYAVGSPYRGAHIGELLVKDSLQQAKANGFSLLQFNAVVKSNERALHLYEKLGFTRLGTVPGGFLMPDGHYEDIVLLYHTL